MMEDKTLFGIVFGGNLKWKQRARCVEKGAPPREFFFSAHTREDAKLFCEPCPVRAECLHYAETVVDIGVRGKDLAGVYGGMSPKERAARRRVKKLEDKKRGT